MNWNQTGMPSALVSRLGKKREFAEFKSVLSDAQNQILQPMDVEAMAQELMETGGTEFVDMVRGLTMALSNAKKELEEANRRCERLLADLARLGVSPEEGSEPRPAGSLEERPARKAPFREPPSLLDGQAEWEEWDRRFRSLLD